jgi:hypothetical protein
LQTSKKYGWVSNLGPLEQAANCLTPYIMASPQDGYSFGANKKNNLKSSHQENVRILIKTLESFSKT